MTRLMDCENCGDQVENALRIIRKSCDEGRTLSLEEVEDIIMILGS